MGLKHLVFAAAIMSAGPALASSFSADYVFGDSLSDRGNLAEAVGHNFPTPPFFEDSLTNGPNAVQVMAQHLGLSADPSLFLTGFKDINGLGLTPGTNYAVAGAAAGPGAGNPLISLGSQVGAFLLKDGGVAPASALYTVFIGGNDVRAAAHGGDTSLVAQGVESELTALGALIGAGAQNLLVVNVPDVGAIPDFTIGDPANAAQATSDSKLYNSGLATGIATLAAAAPGVDLKLFDLYDFESTLFAGAAGLGITDTTSPCYVSYGGITGPAPLVINPACGAIDPATNQAANIGQFFFWDAIHPTAKIQAALGDALYAFTEPTASPVPLPGSLALFAVGLVALAGLRHSPGRRHASAKVAPCQVPFGSGRD